MAMNALGEVTSMVLSTSLFIGLGILLAVSAVAVICSVCRTA
jgi:hypothetical protein